MSKPDITTKKGIKEFVNANGAFNKMQINAAEVPAGVEVPEGAKFFRGIASNGDLNRNGYIIEEQAFQASIKTYMENPVILLQHNPDQPIGKAISAKVTDNGLEVEGFIFQNLMDETSWKAFENGVLKGLSTGHITKHAKFKNEETGRIVDEDAVGTEGNPSWWDLCFDAAWTMIVTALDWVEFSLVTIPANQKSMVTETNATEEERTEAIKKYAVNSGKVEQNELEAPAKTEEAETPAEEATEEVAENEGTEQVETPETTENEGGTPEAVEESENEETTDVEAEETATEEEVEETEPEEDVETPAVEETADAEPELKESLLQMTKNLAHNLAKAESEIEANKGAMKEADVNAIVEVQINGLKTEYNEVLTKMAETIQGLSAQLVEANSRLDKIAVNKPNTVQMQLEKTKKMDSWA